MWASIGLLGKDTFMAKGMTKRGRDEKKPKKVVAKTNASAPSLKNLVAGNTTLQIKTK